MASRTIKTRNPHNEAVLKDLEVGDMVEFPRGVYSHWGVYLGNEEIVHLTGDGDGRINSKDGAGSVSYVFTICGMEFDKAVVKIENFWDVVNGCEAKKNNDKDRKCSPSSIQEMMERVRTKLGRITYNLIWSNCEHFASYIRYGEKWSEQIDTLLTGGMWVGAALVVGGLMIGAMFGGSRDSKGRKS